MNMQIKLYIEKLDRNIKLSPCLINHQLTKTYGGLEAYLYVFLTSALKVEAWSASLHYRSIPGERASGIHWKAGLLRASLSVLRLWRREISNALPGIQPRFLVVQLVA
jgi:hypothetical protein